MNFRQKQKYAWLIYSLIIRTTKSSIISQTEKNEGSFQWNTVVNYVERMWFRKV